MDPSIQNAVESSSGGSGGVSGSRWGSGGVSSSFGGGSIGTAGLQTNASNDNISISKEKLVELITIVVNNIIKNNKQ